MFTSRWMPCPDCGASVERGTVGHACDPDRRATYQFFRHHDEVVRLVPDIGRWLESTAGRFEVWLAARRVRGN